MWTRAVGGQGGFAGGPLEDLGGACQGEVPWGEYLTGERGKGCEAGVWRKLGWAPVASEEENFRFVADRAAEAAERLALCDELLQGRGVGVI